MKKKVIIALLCTGCLMLASCGKKDVGNEGKDPLTGVEESSQAAESTSEASTGDTRDFDDVVSSAAEPSEIIDYINTNLPNATEDDANRYFTGLLGYGDDVRNIDFTQLEDSKQYMPEDMIAFMDLMKLEADTPSMVMSTEDNRKVIGMTLSEMLERALLFEQHLDKYPDNVTTEAAQTLYEEIATAAITGGYDKENGVEHYYQGDTADVVDEQALYDALTGGEIAAAGLDVLVKEPIAADNPLARIQDSEKLLITPHMAWGSNEARSRCAREVYLNIKSFLAGEKRNVVN